MVDYYITNHGIKNQSFINRFGQPVYFDSEETDKKEPLKPQLQKPVDDVGFGGSKLTGALHAVVFKKPVDLDYIIEESKKFIKRKNPFFRETNTSVRVRNIPKTKFEPKSFRTKKINPYISLVFGTLK
jgi:hypothetical protein